MRRLSLLFCRVTAGPGFGLLFALGLALALDAGCTPDTRRSGSDSGTRLPPEVDAGDDVPPPPPPSRDAGGIRLMDSGPPPTPDSGPPPPTPGACRLDGPTPLPVACLPRCSSATDTAIRSCTDGACVTTTLQADTTPATTLTLPSGETTALDCELCVSFQLQSCWVEFCPTELANFLDCRDAGGTCTVESDALDLCREPTTVVNCENTRLGGCFP